MAAPWEKYKNPAANYGPDPAKVREIQMREEDQQMQREAASRAAAAQEQANALAQAKFAYEQSKGQELKLPTGYRMKADGSGAELIPGVAAPGANAKGDPGKAGAYKSVIQQIDRLYELYNQGIGSTEGVAGILDYLPTEANAMFDTAGAALGDQGNAAFKVPGMGAQSDADAARFVAANQPMASDRDAAALEKLRALRQRLEANMQAQGLPAPQWNYDLNGAPIAAQPQNDQAVAGNAPQQDRSNQSAVLFGGPGQDGGGGGFAPYGATMKTEANPQWKGVNQAVKGMIVAGRSPDEIKTFLNSKGIAGDAARGVDEAINYFRKTGKDNFGVDVEKIQVPMSGTEQFLNNAPQTRVGTAAATALNAGGFGIPQMLAGGEGLDYLRSQNPGSAFTGDVAGVIGGTAALGRAGGAVAGRVAPNLLGGGAKSAAGRQLATDVGYGAIYGGTTEGTPEGVLTGALTAGIGSGLGMGIGKGIQKGLTGVTDPAVQYLTQRGIPLSLGEMLGNNSIVGRNMQKLESMPYLGDLMAARRGEAKDAVYRAALEDSVAPVGGQLDAANPLASAQQTVSSAYDNAVGNVNVPIDEQLASQFGNARNMAANLPPDLKGKFDAAMASRVDPITNQKVYYHGSAADIEGALRPGETGRFGPGIYLTPDKKAAISYAGDKGEAGVYERTIRGQLAPDSEFNSLYGAVPIDARPRPFTPEGKAYQEGVQQQLREKGFVGIEGTDAYGAPAVNVIDPAALAPAGMSGQDYQQAMRGLSGYKAEATKPGFEQDYRDAISMVQDALKGQMMRGGGESVVSGLNKADQAYSILKPIEQATISARGTPTPKQMLGAFTNNTKKYGGVGAAARGDKVPDVIRYAAENAPTISNSGTADRLGVLAPLLLPTALGGASYSVSDMSPTSAGFLATLAAMSTKTGQKALQKAVTSRSPALRKAGGMFGSRKAQKALGAGGAGALLSYFGD